MREVTVLLLCVAALGAGGAAEESGTRGAGGAGGAGAARGAKGERGSRGAGGAASTGGIGNKTTYSFFRQMGTRGGGGAGASGRRVFGGRAAQLAEFANTCALLDRYFATRCSGAVLATHWALTAAHCVAPPLAYVRYNTRRPAAADGDIAVVHYLYRHPEYRVLQEEAGGVGLDVTLLHHDVGLVRTRDAMALTLAPLPRDPLRSLSLYDPITIIGHEVQVFGFGRTESAAQGEELCSARLRLVRCERAAWYHVVCGAAVAGGAGGGGGGGGVCAGDSGGALLLAGVQLAVTSLGPRYCARADAMSVFTVLRPYVDVLNATIADTDATLRMRVVSRAAAPLAHHARAAFALLLFKRYMSHLF